MPLRRGRRGQAAPVLRDEVGRREQHLVERGALVGHLQQQLAGRGPRPVVRDDLVADEGVRPAQREPELVENALRRRVARAVRSKRIAISRLNVRTRPVARSRNADRPAGPGRSGRPQRSARARARPAEERAVGLGERRLARERVARGPRLEPRSGSRSGSSSIRFCSRPAGACGSSPFARSETCDSGPRSPATRPRRPRGARPSRSGPAGRPRAAGAAGSSPARARTRSGASSSDSLLRREGLERPVAQLAAETDDDGSGRQQLVAGGVAKDRRRPLRVRVLVEHLAPGLLRVARRRRQPQRQQARPARLQLARPPKRPAAARASLSFTATTRASAAATGSSITAGSGPCRTRRRRS